MLPAGGAARCASTVARSVSLMDERWKNYTRADLMDQIPRCKVAWADLMYQIPRCEVAWADLMNQIPRCEVAWADLVYQIPCCEVA